MSTKDKVAIVCKYCAQDTWLVIQLIVQLCIITNISGMSSISRVPIQYIELKGQQVKVHSQLAHESRNENYLIPVIPYKRDEDPEEEKFTGATVLDANPGAHFEPIAGLDFASLYPSIMMAHNYCYSTIVEDPEFDNLEGVEYKDIDWIDEIDGEKIKHNARFVQNKSGLLPRILEKLWKWRKSVKKQMKVAGTEEYNVLNGLQLAIKVSMNSIYGFTGARFGRLPNKKIAAAVTAVGRDMIAHSKECAEKWYNCEVVYGDTDSIYVKFKTKFKGQEHMNEVFRIAPECAARISETFKKPIELEFEKVMYPFILFSKKRYADLMWTNPNTYDYIDYKGIQVVRRDNCPYVREQSKKIFEGILLNKKVLEYSFESIDEIIEDSKKLARNSISSLINGEIPMKDLIVSKSLRANYAFDNKAKCTVCDKIWYELNTETGKKNMAINKLTEFLKEEQYCPSCKKNTKFIKMKANIPHVALARTMKERDPFNCPHHGDRVPYVFIKGSGTRQFERVEDPTYVVNYGLEIDYIYYFEHQLKSSVETIFEPLPGDTTEIWKGLFEEKIKKTRKKKEV